MALPRPLKHQFEWALIFTLCFLTFAILPYKSVGRLINNNNSNQEGKEEEEVMKLVLGSRPPSCINKCMNCSPCMAVLVTPPPHRRIHKKSSELLTPQQEEENYYLLGWKCKCKNKLFPP